MEEIWRDIEGYEGIYRVSNLGRVKSLARNIYLHEWPMPLKERILKPYPNKKGYLGIDLRKDNKRKCPRVHRLVAQAFITNPENKPQVNHKDCNKTNNKVDNLEWCNNSENQIHAWANGMQPTGDDRNISRKKIICVDTGDIFNSIKDAAKFANSSRSNIYACCVGNTSHCKGHKFKYLDCDIEYNFVSSGPAGLPARKVKCIETGIIHNSLTEASKWLNKIKGGANIGAVCRGKLKKAYGYHWEYVND